MASKVKNAAKKNGRPEVLDVVGLAEAAELLGVERARIGKWRIHGILLANGDRVKFPDPIVVKTSLATVKRCTADATLYSTLPKDRRCPTCSKKGHEIVTDHTKLAATPLWWGEDVRKLAELLATNKPRD